MFEKGIEKEAMKSLFWVLGAVWSGAALVAKPVETNGIYPHLSYYNYEGECGTGAVVPWAGSLWVITYGPHCPTGSSDKLYEIKPDLRKVVRPESVGGTPADRLIHRETDQLLIGPYVINAQGTVRTVPIAAMPGRLTAAARHLTDSNKVYVATMETGLYELDMRTLSTRTLIRENGMNDGAFAPVMAKAGKWPEGWETAPRTKVPGYHGKGLASGFGRVYVANNGEYSEEARKNPFIPSGVLADWSEPGQDWRTIRRCQYTEITTRDGIYGNEHPAANTLWALGWDAKSVILTVSDDGVRWTDYRLPKASHSYDGAHGWNTEWPRIREIGAGDDLLATMHGTFWRFPAAFAPGQARGIRPHSTYLKVIGDFCRWGDRVVFGCDDSAKSEFLNKRAAKGALQGPERSQSNLWFVKPSDLDRFGPPSGAAFVFSREKVKKGETTPPYLCAGYDLKWLWLTGGAFDIEIDADGSGRWRKAREVSAAGTDLSDLAGEWLRLVAKEDAENVSAALIYRTEDARNVAKSDAFAAFRTVSLPAGEKALLHVNKTVPGKLGVASAEKAWALDADLTLAEADAKVGAAVRAAAPLAKDVLSYEKGSILYVDDAGKRWRLPYGSDAFRPEPGRICREICTERDHFNAGGIYYELPAENAHGFAGVRPVTTHNAPVYDYASWRGLFVLSLPGALKVGAIDEMWSVGKAVGQGGPWRETSVKAGEPSDPYLMNGFDRKELVLKADKACTVALEVDIDGWGTWVKAGEYALNAEKERKIVFPRAFGGYWARFTSDADAVVTAQFTYR